VITHSVLAVAIAFIVTQERDRRVPVLVVEPAAPPSAAIVAATELRHYDVAHLTGHARLRELVAALTSTDRSARVEDSLASLDALQQRRAEVSSITEGLIATIQETIVPPLEHGIQRVDDLGGGSLALLGTPVQHDWLARFIQEASAFDGLIDVQARIFVLEHGSLAQLSKERSGDVLSKPRLVTLLAALDQECLEAVTSPRITTFPFQRAQLSVFDQVPYIKDYEFRVLPNESAEIADPIIENINRGLQLDLRGTPLIDNKLGIIVKLEYTTLELPIPRFETTFGVPRKPVTVHLPQFCTIKLEGHFELRSEETLLLAREDPTGEKEVLVLLQVLRVDAMR
jgi:hypothetical protein